MSAAAALAAHIDRSQLEPKVRVHAFAKQLGVASKELVAFLAEQGVTKSAQSVLTADEQVSVLDALVGGAEQADAAAPEKAAKKAAKKARKKAVEPVAEEPAPAEDAESDDKLRQRVRKNVDNEISQIEEKVDAELVVAAVEESDEDTPAPRRGKRRAVKRTSARAASASEPAEAGDDDATMKLRDRVRKNVDNEISQIVDKVDAELSHEIVEGGDASDTADTAADYGDTGTIDVEQLHEALVEAGDDFDEDDDLPMIAPIPDDEDHDSYEFAPIFLAPTTRKTPASKPSRRRSSRAEVGTDEPEQIDEPKAIHGSTRIEAQRRRRQELREKGRERKHIVSQAEFLARRESVERTMVVREKARRDGHGTVTQVGVLEDDLLVEHFVTSESQASMIGNIYLGRVQNVLPSMEAAFIDIGQGRNGVLYAGEVDWRQAGLGGRSRRIEHALKSGDQVLVQVAKDPIGHKGARLTTQISLAGRYLVYVPGGRSAGISRKLPVPERKRLKEILERVVPGQGGAIIRTAAENVSEEAIARDVHRLHNLWEDINDRAEAEKRSKGAKPVTLYEEPDLLVKVVRDLFNEDFSQLIVDGKRSFHTVDHYIQSVAPDLEDRVVRYDREEHGGQDAFEAFRIDEQLHKALSRKVWLPSGGTLVIDRTEAMTVIDVNTGKFTGSGGNLEETVTRNNLEAAEEIVRQMRLRDLGGMIVVDFIDMVLPENQDLVLRRLKEALGRDRTRHQVSEVTSLGLVQMTRKRLGTGLIETFATECEACHGRGLIIHEYPVDEAHEEEQTPAKGRRQRRSRATEHPAAVAMHRHEDESHAADAAPKRAKPNYEKLADSVLGVSDENEQDNGEKERRGRRRRGSRGSSRGRAAQSVPEASTSDIEAIAYAAADNAAESDDVEEFTSYVPDRDAESEPRRGRGRRRARRADKHENETPQAEKLESAHSEEPRQTYEEALAEFEASPRRKRRTRGNSRSDHAPRREDFDQPADSEGKAEADNTDRQDDAPQAAAVTRKASGRGRRRAVRRTVADTAPAEQQENSDESTPARRTRKRATRRSVRTTTPSAQDAVTDETIEVPAASAEKVQPAGRGRRRAARRSVR
ncbi:translation initiation factor IF-2 N-terminal domain-containing protein [uncultured Corynebacterium sp.]|uniref:translation initiation factor IF-2 N-terminal domain-containing protein n=1 Tax=uncultured Corynebacterium sp. TaxID=159447 RepID=UPI0025D6ED0E|nr:translation initiation factor IF-2 N-terminal domain-containing protein [uncultured Corynebacterium sp.]